MCIFKAYGCTGGIKQHITRQNPNNTSRERFLPTFRLKIPKLIFVIIFDGNWRVGHIVTFHFIQFDKIINDRHVWALIKPLRVYLK